MSRRRPAMVAGLAGAAVLIASLGLPAGPAAAEPRDGGPSGSARADLIARAGGHATLRPYDGSAFFGAEAGHAAARPSDISRDGAPATAARQWLQRYGELFGVHDAAAQLQVDRTTALRGGEVAVRLQQLRGGLPVVGGGLVVTLDGSNDLVSVTGRTSDRRSLVTAAPAVGAGLAGTLARRAVAKRIPEARALRTGRPVLSVLDRALFGAPDATGPVTVWDVPVTSRTQPVRHRVFVEAARGGVVLDLDENSHATRVVCDTKALRTADPSCPGSSEVVVVADPASSGDSDVVDADRFAAAVDDFYSNYLGRDSLDGNGMTLASTVNFCPNDTTYSCPFANAFWDGAEMVYGDGYAAGLDVVAHELTHGLTEHTSNLFSYYQSGAINESLSDVIGELVQQVEGPALGAYDPTHAWELGEDLGDGPFRLMDHPEDGAYGADPNRMTSGNYNAYPVWSEQWDSGGVHANAGVGNKAAYLVAAGPNGDGTSGSFNGVTMAGVSGDATERAIKTANVYYRVESLLGSAATYRDLANALPQACAQLVGDVLTTPTGSTALTADDCAQVTLAVRATEMSTAPTKTGATVPAAAPYCTNGGGATTKRLDRFESNPLSAGSYKRSHATGLDPYYGQASVGDWWWSKTKIGYYGDTAAPVYQTKGSTASLWGDDADPLYFDPDMNEFSYQDARVRTTNGIKAAAGLFVRFDHAWEFEYSPYFDTSGQPYGKTKYFDGGRVEYSVDGGSRWYDAGARSAVSGKPLLVNGGYNGTITNTDALASGYADPNPLKGKRGYVGSSHGWTSSRLDLSPLKGKRVLLRWRIGADDRTGSLGWFVDNVRVYSCNPTTITLAAPTSVKKGRAASLKAHLVRTGTTAALAGKLVQLWQRRHGTAMWKKVGAPKSTNSHGNARWWRKQSVKTDYRVRFRGQLPLAPSNYATRTVAIG